VGLGYVMSFYLLSLTLRTVPTGVAYAIWSGAGIVLVSGIAYFFLGQKLDAAALAGMGHDCRRRAGDQSVFQDGRPLSRHVPGICLRTWAKAADQPWDAICSASQSRNTWTLCEWRCNGRTR
jgi:hypothetical protein